MKYFNTGHLILVVKIKAVKKEIQSETEQNG